MHSDSTSRFARFAYRSVLASVVGVMAFAVAPEQAQAQDGAIEEVIVTGTFIRRRDSFDTASPIDIMDAADIAERGTPNLGEVVRNQTFNYGVFTVTNILAAAPQGGGSPAANFRGLGAGATLTLLDGRRTASSNLANLYPQIAIARTESLTDGAAAAYGTDAVGGVFNLIPRRRYEGMEVRVSHNAATQGDWDETAWSVIGGASNGPTSFVGAFEYRDRDSLRFFQRDQYSLGAASFSSVSWPGNFTVPDRDAAGNFVTRERGPGGAILSTTIVPTSAEADRLARPDPGCGLNNEASGPDAKAEGVLARRQGILLGTTHFGGTCLWEFGENFMYQPDVESWAGAFFFDHQFTDELTFESEFLVTRSVVLDTGSPSNPGGRNSELPDIPGENPGNPFRAAGYTVVAPASGALGPVPLVAPVSFLYAAPMVDPSTGAVLRDDLGRIRPLRNPATNDVVLADSRFEAIALDDDGVPTNAGGVPFNEDVRIVNWRPVGYPFEQPSRSNSDNTGKGDGMFTGLNYRWVGQMTYDIPDTSWRAVGSYTFNRVTVDGPGGRTESMSGLDAGIRGNLRVKSEEGGSRETWFNPFATQNFVCTNRVCEGGVRQPLMIEHEVTGEMIRNPAVNTPEVWDNIVKFEPTNTETTLNIAEVIADGDLFELPWGMVAGAVGGQWRHTRFAVDAGSVSNALDAYIGIGTPDFSERRSVFAGFAEVNVPIYDNDTLGLLEANLAVRSEAVQDGSDADLDSTNYKVAFRAEPVNWLALRASWGTSFISPSLEDMFAPQTLGISNVTDALTGTGGFLARTLGGNPELEAEEAEVYNLGFTLNLLQGDLNVVFDYKIFDFDDRIIRPVPQEVLSMDFANAVATLGPNPDVFDWLATGLADPRVVRNPETGLLDFVVTDLINARSMEWKGFDTTVSYRFDPRDVLPMVDMDLGRFSTSLTTTYVQSYKYQATEGSPKIEGAGKRNNGTAGVPPSPRWRANLRMGWDWNQHSAVIIGRYTHGVNNAADDDPFCGAGIDGIINAFPQLGVTNACHDTLPSHTEWDAQYNLNLDGFWGNRAATLTLGLINAFDKEPTAMRTLGGLETQLYDPRGRIWYVRMTQEI